VQERPPPPWPPARLSQDASGKPKNSAPWNIKPVTTQERAEAAEGIGAASALTTGGCRGECLWLRLE
jgi:hypothetical protein